MSDQLQPVEVSDEAVEAAHREISYPIGIVRSADGGRSITRFALTAAAPILTANLKQRIEELEGELEAEKTMWKAAVEREIQRAMSAEQRLEEARGG